MGCVEASKFGEEWWKRGGGGFEVREGFSWLWSLEDSFEWVESGLVSISSLRLDASVVCLSGLVVGVLVLLIFLSLSFCFLLD